MAKPPETPLEQTKRLMGALVRQPPKQHDEMKIGKPEGKPIKNRPEKRPGASAKPKSARRPASRS
jgi:hypothetical protein